MKRKITSTETGTSEEIYLIKVGESLYVLQPSDTDTATLVEADRYFRNVPTEKKTEASENQIKVTSKDKAVEIKSEVKREIEAEDLTQIYLVRMKIKSQL